MSQARTAILYAPGTNCHEETAAAIELAGGKADLVLLKDLLGGESRLDDYQAAVVPGGFSYGDHLGAGRIFATMLVARLRDQLVRFLDAKKPLLGICNGYQVLTEAGILPGRTPGERAMALLENQSARFEDRKVRHDCFHRKVRVDGRPGGAGAGDAFRPRGGTAVVLCLGFVIRDARRFPLRR